ncbi:MAG: hypothetical protein KF708_02155 [Pirellulales bacterium]|nr:hypothetical protein [Pirellulales bacterium]
MKNYIQGSLARAARLVEQQCFAAALAELRPLETHLADCGWGWQLRGLAQFGLGNIAQATAAFEHASLLVPLDPLAQLRLAQCYCLRRQRDVAQVMYRHLATLEMLPEEEIEAIAIGLARVGEHRLALQYCLVQHRRFRGNHKLLYTIAVEMRRLNYDNDEILPFIYQAHRLQPANVFYRIAFAQHLLTAQRRVEATRVLQGVDLDTVHCIPSLEWMRILFSQLSLAEGVEHCRARLQAIAFEANSGYRRPREER